jgi:predicted secreted protein
MAALVGRKITLTPTAGGVAIIGGRSTSININNESIDITSNDDNGFRTLLGDDPALRSIDITMEGILKDAEVIKIASQGGSNLIEAYDLNIQGIGTFSGDFYIGTLSIAGTTQEAVTYNLSIQSSGEFDFVEPVVGP